MSIIKFKILIVSLFVIQFIVAEELKSADALQDNMVVQQSKPFKVWGVANKSSEVMIIADWLKKPVTTYADDLGEFVAFINVPKAKRGDFTKHIIKIESEGTTKAISNLLIGDL